MSSPINRVEIVQRRLLDYLSGARTSNLARGGAERLTPSTELTVEAARAIFEDQLMSRLLDVAAREMKRLNQGYYTISSAGHENNAIIGQLLRLDDPCFLHYRAGGMMMARSR
ncbi:MAG: MFS transporter, partial [Acidobacteriota bacterium]